MTSGTVLARSTRLGATTRRPAAGPEPSAALTRLEPMFNSAHLGRLQELDAQHAISFFLAAGFAAFVCHGPLPRPDTWTPRGARAHRRRDQHRPGERRSRAVCDNRYHIHVCPGVAADFSPEIQYHTACP